MENPPENTVVIVSDTPPPSTLDDGLCSICVEKPNKQRPWIQCPCCNHKACSRCTKKYLLSIPTPKCMKCAKPWTRSFLSNQFPAAFIREWKNKQIQSKYEREISLLPLAQAVLDHEKQKQALVQAVEVVQDHIAELMARLNSAKMEKFRLARNLYIYESNYKKGINVYVRPCPNDSCRGFLSTDWKCGICDSVVCSQCHEIKKANANANANAEQLTCNEDSVKTAKMIQADSRPCPKCHAYIFKIDGCNQLWCVNCHTAFHWNTGCIIEDTRYFHNPHYFEWIQSQSHELDDDKETATVSEYRDINPVFISLFTQAINPLSTLHAPSYERLTFFIQDKCRKIVELRRDVLPKYTVSVEKENEDLRLDYLKNRVDSKRFHDVLSRRYTLQESRREYGQIMTMFVNASTDIAYRLRTKVHGFMRSLETIDPPVPSVRTRSYQRPPKVQHVPLTEGQIARLGQLMDPLFQELETLRIYTNECLSETRQSFGLKREYYVDAQSYDWKHTTVGSTPVVHPPVLSGELVPPDETPVEPPDEK